MTAAFITAKLTREKKMTPLKDLLISDAKRRRKKRVQTVEDHKNAFDALVIMTGGNLGGEPSQAVSEPQ